MVRRGGDDQSQDRLHGVNGRIDDGLARDPEQLSRSGKFVVGGEGAPNTYRLRTGTPATIHTTSDEDLGNFQNRTTPDIKSDRGPMLPHGDPIRTCRREKRLPQDPVRRCFGTSQGQEGRSAEDSISSRRESCSGDQSCTGR